MRYSHVFRRITAAGLAAAAAGLAVPGAAHAAPAAPFAHGSPGTGPEGSAYGVTVTGPVNVPPVPAVSSTAGEARKSLLSEDHTRLVKASVLDVKATAGHARSTVARVAVPTAKLLASAVAARCDAGRGAAHLAHAVIAGRRLNAAPPPNTTIPVDVDGIGRTALILNKQQRLPDGRLTVTAIELALPLGKATIRIASATCGRPSVPAEAPAPTPVKSDLPVTG